MNDQGPTADRASRLPSAAVGAVAGAVATIVMTVFRGAIARSLPPTEEFWAALPGTDRSGDALPALGLHLLYGAAAGAVFGAGAGPHVRGREVNRERRGAAFGTVYGMLLSVGGRWLLVEGLLRLDLDPDERFVFHAGHVVYGLTLGTWFGAYE